MTDPERDHLFASIRDLQRANGQWRAIALGLLLVVVLLLILTGGLGFSLSLRFGKERREADDLQRQAYEAMHQAQAQQAKAEEQLQRAERELEKERNMTGKKKD